MVVVAMRQEQNRRHQTRQQHTIPDYIDTILHYTTLNLPTPEFLESSSGSHLSASKARYWLTPPALYHTLDSEFHFDYDPCPCPRPDGYDSLLLPWGKSNYVNPPFRRHDGVDGAGPTAFVRKAIEEQKKGNSSVLLIPVQSYVNLLLEAGAEARSMGRVRWLEADGGEECKSPSPICCFVLKG